MSKWQPRAICPNCGWHVFSPRRSFLYVDYCSNCGLLHKRSDDWHIEPMRWISESKWWNPKTWKKGYWQTKEDCNMMIEIPIPDRYISYEDKRQFIEELIIWGQNNLNDQENWRYKTVLLRSSKFKVTSNVIRFEMNDGEDAMALKLTWCE